MSASRNLSLICLLFLTLALLCAQTVAEWQFMERQKVRSTFVRGERSPAEHIHRLIIAVNQRNLDELAAITTARATPGNPLYQQWLSMAEVDALTSNPDASMRVLTWLRSIDGLVIKKITRRKDYIFVDAPISVWEKIFHAEFYQYRDDAHHRTKKHVYHRAMEYSIPLALRDDISAVFNIVQAPPLIPRRYHARADTPRVSRLRAQSFRTQSSGVTVSFLNELYKIDSNLGSASLNQSVFETDTEYFSQSDLKDFQETYSLTVQSAISRGGHETSSCGTQGTSCDEGNLDIQYIMGVAQLTTSIFWYVPDDDVDPFVLWITEVANDPNPPQSNSISWGAIEITEAEAYLKHFNAEAEKLASLGVTISVSSGDDGAPNYSDTYGCLCDYDSSSKVSDWQGDSSWSGEGYFPNFPASNPWVVAVGATMGPLSGDPEVACQSQLGGVITTGGGFSTYFEQPDYQKTAISNYFAGLSSSEQPSAGYNPEGRGYPDVAFIGTEYNIIIDGSTFFVSGTSCSAPVFAAMVSLLNAERLENNLTAIGFLNPTLYSYGVNQSSRINDVTSGNNKCCSSSSSSTAVCCSSGFTAITGWDPVTGWGSIDYTQFAAMFNTTASYSGGGGSNSDSALTDGEIAAAVICSVIGCGLLIGALYYLFVLPKAANAASAPIIGYKNSPTPPETSLTTVNPTGSTSPGGYRT